MNYKRLRRRLRLKQLLRRMKLQLIWLWLRFKHLWSRIKLPFFVLFSLALPVIDYRKIYPHLYSVTVYILGITLLIAFVQWWYRERSPTFNVPKLQFASPKKIKNAQLKLTEVLQQEYDYVKETASQAMNDRHTMVNYFLLSAGVVLAGFGVMVSEEGGAKFPYRFEIIVGMSLIFNIVGWVYFMQVVRLRQAWCESARAMNHIKVLYAKNCELLPKLAEKAFRWNIYSLPEAAKKMTVFYFSALLISILNAAAITFASTILPNIKLLLETDQLRKTVFFDMYSFRNALLLGLYHLFFQMSMYTALLEEPPASEIRTKKLMKKLEARYLKN